MAVLLLGACGSSTTREEIESYQQQADSLSVEIGRNVTIRYTDSARLKATITAPLMERYPQLSEPYLEMTEGLTAQFYDDQGNVSSNLSANYGKHYERKELIELRNNVHVKNKIGEELESEELFWDQKTKRIFTEKFVKITRNDELIYGEGFESNERFTKYKILKPSGRVKIKEQEKDSTNSTE